MLRQATYVFLENSTFIFIRSSNLRKYSCQVETHCLMVRLSVEKKMILSSTSCSRAIYASKCELLWTLAKQESLNEPPVSSLPAKARKSLLKALVLAGSGVTEDSSREQYFHCVSPTEVLEIYWHECLCIVWVGNKLNLHVLLMFPSLYRFVFSVCLLRRSMGSQILLLKLWPYTFSIHVSIHEPANLPVTQRLHLWTSYVTHGWAKR